MTVRDLLDDTDVPADSLSRIFVETRHSRKGFERVDALLKEPRTTNHAWGLPLIGPPRCGKTTFVKEYLRACFDKLDGRRPLRYLHVELREDTKTTRIAHVTLRYMSDPNPGYGDLSARTDRVVDGIKRHQYDLIIFDEVHHLVDSNTLRVEEKGAHWIVGLLNEARVPMLLVGYDRFQAVIERNPALGGRLKPFPAFRAFRHGDGDDMEELQGVLGAIDENLGLDRLSGLSDPEIARRICVCCLGRLGLVELFLTHARSLARESRYACLTWDILLQAAAEMLAGWATVPFNPFEVPDLEEAIRRRGPITERQTGAPAGKGR